MYDDDGFDIHQKRKEKSLQILVFSLKSFADKMRWNTEMTNTSMDGCGGGDNEHHVKIGFVLMIENHN